MAMKHSASFACIKCFDRWDNAKCYITAMIVVNTVLSPHLPDNNANCVYSSQPLTLHGCFPFRTTSVALFFQNHVSTHGQGLVFSHPSNAVKGRADNLLLLSSATHKNPAAAGPHSAQCFSFHFIICRILCQTI